jgi:hypothetical protein
VHRLPDRSCLAGVMPARRAGCAAVTRPAARAGPAAAAGAGVQAAAGRFPPCRRRLLVRHPRSSVDLADTPARRNSRTTRPTCWPGFVLARSSAGLSDGTIRGEVSNLEQVREWFGRPLWEIEPAAADAYFGRVMRAAASGTRHARAGALVTYFAFLELRHQAELHALTGQVVTCPVDEMNRPRGRKDARLRIPPREGRGGAAVHRVGRRAGDVPQVRADSQELRRGAADGRDRAARQRGPPARPGGREVGAGAVREGPRALRQGIARVRAARADGPADQRRGTDAALVCRGRVGPVR